jgi:glycerol kinase
MLVNTGAEILRERGLISTVAWAVDSERSFAMEGSILSSGTVVEWLKSVGLWSDNVGEETSLHFVPAFFGLGSPYWDPYARGLILGITPYTSREHITRAALESIAFMVADILHMISKHVSMPFIRADGGMSANEFLMQFQSDILGIPVQVPEFGELTALGAAMLSAVGAGERDMEEIRDVVRYDREYIPEKPAVWRERRMERWHEAVRRSMGWGGASWEN